MTDYTPIYILTWNPKKFIWDDYEQVRKIVEEEGGIVLEWSVRSKKPKEGDRFILLMQGMSDMNGVVGYGTFFKDPEDYMALPTEDAPFGTRFAQVWLENLADITTGRYVKTKALKEKFPEQCWNPQMSGIRVKSKYVPKIWEIVNEQNMSVKR